MKKILLSAIIASSLTIAGDLTKCTEAYIMQDKLEVLINKTQEEAEKYRDTPIVGDYQKKKEDFLYGLQNEWSDVAKKECQGVVYGKNGRLHPNE